jgi:protein TonB
MRRESALTSLLIHAVVLLMLFGIVVVTAPVPTIDRPVILANSKLAPYSPNTGAGGQHAKTEASAGRLPPRARMVFVPPMVTPTNRAPKLVMEAALDLPPDMKLPDSNLPNIGDPAGLGKLLSGGIGGPAGIGEGPGRGIGSSPGPGVGNPAVYIPGRGGVTMPVPIHKVEPEYSDEARKAHAMGVVLVAIEVGPDGKPTNIRVTRGFGMGLDEKATEAVRQWRFRPGTKDGKPVTVAAQIEVAFHLL